jgi:hypothetical protein
MDHNYRGHINARHDGFQDRYYFGKRPAGIYIPRFRNIGPDKQPHFLRGYAFAAGGNRHTGHLTNDTIGASLKEQMTEAGPWEVWMTGMGECLPAYENKVTLSTGFGHSRNGNSTHGYRSQNIGAEQEQPGMGCKKCVCY